MRGFNFFARSKKIFCFFCFVALSIPPDVGTITEDTRAVAISVVGAHSHLADADDLTRLLLDEAVIASAHAQDIEAVRLLVFTVPRDINRRTRRVRAHDGSAIIDGLCLPAATVVEEEHRASGGGQALVNPGKLHQLRLLQALVGAAVNDLDLGVRHDGEEA